MFTQQTYRHVDQVGVNALTASDQSMANPDLVLTGTPGDDVLVGGAGNDQISGGDGNDTISAGAGNDVVSGGRGNDTVDLGAGNDTFTWNPGDGNDAVEGGSGNDTLVFNGSAVAEEKISVEASGSHVTLFRDVGNTTTDLHGIETLHLAPVEGIADITVGDLRQTDLQHVQVDLSAQGGGGNGSADLVTVQGSDAGDAINFSTQNGDAVVNGLGAQTVVHGAEAADIVRIDGGAGDDTVKANGTTGDDVFNISADGANTAVVTNGGPAVETANVEHLVIVGGAGNDTMLAGNGLAGHTQLTLDGGAGDDTLVGGDGDDILLGGAGNDSVSGGRGNDTVDLGAGNDTFTWNPGDGNDTVEGGAGNDTLVFNGSAVAEEKISVEANGSHVTLFRDVGNTTTDLHGIETLHLAPVDGIDDITVGDLRQTDLQHVQVDLSDQGGGGNGSADLVTVQGSDAGDTLNFSTQNGDAVVNGLGAQTVIHGAEAADIVRIDGGAGDDTVKANGTTGDDVFNISADGANTAVVTNGGPAVETANVEHLVIVGGAGNDTMLATHGTAGLAQMTLDGGAGDDTLAGGDGNDILLGGAGNDSVSGGWGNDTADLGAGNDTFTWNQGGGSDTVEGGAGNDTLVFNGSNANETISLEANGSHVTLFRDVANVSMDLHGIETLHLGTAGGADDITVGDLRGTDVKQVQVDLGLPDSSPDGQADTVTVTGSDRAEKITLTLQGSAVVVDGLSSQVVVDHFDAGDTLRIAAGGGNDIIDTRGLGTSGPHVVIDLGAASALTDFDSLVQHSHEQAGNAVIDLGDGHHLTLVGVDIGALHAEDFLFATDLHAAAHPIPADVVHG